MLPFRLSADLCSLRAGIPRLAHSVFFDLTPQGKILYEFFMAQADEERFLVDCQSRLSAPQTIEHAYASDDIPRQWAEMNKMGIELAKKVVAENFPTHLILPTSVGPIDLSIEEAVRNKFIPRALTDDEVKKMFGKVAEANR